MMYHQGNKSFICINYERETFSLELCILESFCTELVCEQGTRAEKYVNEIFPLGYSVRLLIY